MLAQMAVDSYPKPRGSFVRHDEWGIGNATTIEHGPLDHDLVISAEALIRLGYGHIDVLGCASHVGPTLEFSPSWLG